MHRFRALGLASLALAFPLAAHADKKADEEWKKVNPPVPYKLWVGGDEYGSKEIRGIFAEKNAKKKWRPFYDTWFTLVPEREGAEILVDVGKKGFDSRPGYKTVFYTEGRLTVRGIVTGVAIRGDDLGGRLFRGPQDEFDLLNRIVRFMRSGHKEAVLAHTSSSAAAHATSREPKPAAPPPPSKGPLVEEDNETYGYWERFRPGSWVVLKFEGTLKSETKQTLKSVSPSEIVLEVRRRGSGTHPESVPRRVKVEAKDKKKGWKEATESAEISGKLLQCRTQTAGTMKRWYCPDIPGGFARMEWSEKEGKLVQRVLATSWEAKR